MSMNTTPSGERPHIGFFGLRNAGKSSVVNAVTGQALSLVSEVKGTTTDPVQKAMELLPAGPVVIIDTPGMDDEGALGEQRVQRALRTLDKTDVAVLVVDAAVGLREADRDLLRLFQEKQVPSLTVPVKPGRNLAVIIEVAAMNNRHKKMGYNAALEFTKQINEHFDQAMSAQLGS